MDLPGGSRSWACGEVISTRMAQNISKVFKKNQLILVTLGTPTECYIRNPLELHLACGYTLALLSKGSGN